MEEDRTLLPCPFCGGNARYMEDLRYQNRQESFPKWYVKCMDCDVCTPLGVIPAVQKIWNRRVEGNNEDRG